MPLKIKNSMSFQTLNDTSPKVLTEFEAFLLYKTNDNSWDLERVELNSEKKRP